MCLSVFLNLLDDLDYKFFILGLSETKFITDKDLVDNISIPGYSFVSKPSLSNAGGVGLFVKSDLNYTIREDLSQVEPEFETIWIEVDNRKHHNILCAVMYRHPSSNLDSFFTYLQNCMEKVNNENKYYILIGDFNFNLLNSETHPKTEYFLNILMTSFFQPHILSPTRITHRTATLIDNNLDLNNLIQLYYSLIYPFLIYGLIVWGNTYITTLNPIIILQKKAVRIITFSKFHDHSTPLFKLCNIVKFPDLIYLTNAVFMFDYYSCSLPSTFDHFFIPVNKVHSYNTRLASKKSYKLQAVRTNYGKFSIRFQGPSIWNKLDENLKLLSWRQFKYKLKITLLTNYQ